jgi:hypothetical protein
MVQEGIVLGHKTIGVLDIVLVYLLDSITLGILLAESYYNWHSYACKLFCLA